MPTSGVAALDRMLAGGYPEKSAILVEGPPGNEKEALSYKFLHSGLGEGHFCLYITRLPPQEIIQDARACGVDFASQNPLWMSPEGGNRDYSPSDLAAVSFGVKEILKGHQGTKTRIAFDGLSQLLTLHSPESVYKFLGQLLYEAKRQDSVMLATVQEGMHQPQVVSSMELLFDGVLAVRRNDTGGLEVTIKKMRGLDLSSSSIVLNIPREGEPSTPRVGRHRVAVLPFASISPDPNDEYFADGLTEELISTISKISELSVIARTSVMQYKKTPKPIKEVSKELQAGTILEGSARLAGSKLRVTVQMIDADQDRHLWAESYDRELRDIFAIQSEIATQVAEALRVRILFPEMKRIEKRPTESTAAYMAYLRGKSLYNNRWGTDGVEVVKQAVEYFDQSVKEDSGFALGYIGQADCWLDFSFYRGIDSKSNLVRAKKSIARALELDSGSAEAHSTKAVSLLAEHKTHEAEDELKKATFLNPSHADAHSGYSGVLAFTERWDQALEEIEKAEELDPLSRAVPYIHGRLYNLKRDFAKAIPLLKRAADLGDVLAHEGLIEAYGKMKMLDEMRREAQAYVRLAQRTSPLVGMAADVQMAVLQGDRPIVRKLLPELETHLREAAIDAYRVATYYFFLGQNDKGFEWLEKSFSNNDYRLYLVRGDWNLDGVRTDPRYLDILKRIGLEMGVV